MNADSNAPAGAGTSESDPHRTHTAEFGIEPSVVAPTSNDDRIRNEHAPSDAAAAEPAGTPMERTAVLPIEEMDQAAVSFARERARALTRLDHTASVARLRRALTIGFPVWTSAILLDLFVTRLSNEGSFTTFVELRCLGALVVLATIWRLRRAPEPSVAALWFYDMLVFTTVSVCVSAISLAFRGIESPYGPSVVVIMLARGATTLAPWQHGAWLFAAPGLAYPVTVLVAARFDPLIEAQLENPASQVTFTILLFMIVVSWMMLVLGGHFAWRLRREAIETRNIGRYQLLRRLGSGGGGEVWEAFDTTLRQRVALKTVSGHRPGSQLLARLEREVRALSELTHPNTVRIFDYGTTDDGLWYYAMELLHGENLHELISREGPLSIERLSSIGRQVLRALGEAHQKGIIHRDIKPENVFVAQVGGDADLVKLLDFGIAHTSGDPKLTRTGFVAGTPAYMAPETIMGNPADVRADIYSFGATVYFALTGQLPFSDEDPMALFAAHVSRPILPISAVSSRPIPQALELLVQRCMAKDPAERYPSTQAVLRALNDIAS